MNSNQQLVTSVVTPADVLRAAKHYVAVFGWHQGGMFADFGWPCPPACAEGAIRFAVVGDTGEWPAEATDDGRVDLFLWASDVLAQHLLNCGVLSPTDGPMEFMPYEVVSEWNDDPDRNVAQVLAALNGAALEWERRHLVGVA